MTTDSELKSKLHAIIMDILAVDEDELRPSATFMGDLGGESIDLLELSFRCEKEFGTKIEFQKMFPVEELGVNERNELMPETLERIKHRLPFLDVSRIGENPHIERLFDLLTVDAIFCFLRRTLDARARSIGAIQPAG